MALQSSARASETRSPCLNMAKTSAARAIKIVLRSFHEPEDLIFGEVLALAISRIGLAAVCVAPDRLGAPYADKIDASVSVVDSK